MHFVTFCLPLMSLITSIQSASAERIALRGSAVAKLPSPTGHGFRRLEAEPSDSVRYDYLAAQLEREYDGNCTTVVDNSTEPLRPHQKRHTDLLCYKNGTTADLLAWGRPNDPRPELLTTCQGTDGTNCTYIMYGHRTWRYYFNRTHHDHNDTSGRE
jgi:hypothetical protein